jgi:hypothetical protein
MLRPRGTACEDTAGRHAGFPVEIKTILQHFIVRNHGDLDTGSLRRCGRGALRFRS